jgi:glycosyltransferase involved in cell wall biosynthesis
VPYGIDTARFQPTPSALRAAWGVGGGPVALFVGRMEVRKGIDALVPAFAEVARRMPEAILVTAGPDTAGDAGRVSQQQWMMHSWAAAGLAPDRVRMLGPVAPEDLPALYSAADVMVAPSPYEAFGLVYLEAMACGTVPIGCTTGGVPEIVEDGVTGRLVPPGDAPALAAALVELLRDSGMCRRLGAAGRTVVTHDYSLEAVVRRTEAFYGDVTTRRAEAAA